MRVTWRLLWYGTAALLFLAGLLSAGAYWLTPYPALLRWYLGLNDCFYRVESWPQQFFTPAVKAQGNGLALLAVVLCGAGLGLLRYCWRQPQLAAAPLAAPRPGWLAAWPDALNVLGLLAISGGLWWGGSRLVVQGTDEVFSALYCAPLPAFQTVAYYMAPNNHLLFNLLNGSLFGRSPDLVATGRLLSGVAYLLTVAAVYGWFRALTGNRALAVAVALTAALQYNLWGFGFQARGYALHALAHWGAFIGLFGYLRTRRPGWLLLNGVCCVVGYATVPTFLFFHLAQLLFGVLYYWQRRALDWRFWRYQLATLLAVYLFYLPALGFSGLAALIKNEHVQPTTNTLADFLPTLGRGLDDLVHHCFSYVEFHGPLSVALVLLPLVLLLARRSTAWFAYGLFYACLLAVAVGLMLGMRHLVNLRNLIGHCSLALTLVPATLYWVAGALPASGRRLAQPVVVLPVLLLLNTTFLVSNPIVYPVDLYLADNSHATQAVIAELAPVRSGQSVAYSWNSFYTYSIGQQRGLRGYLPCPSPPAQADFYVTRPTESLPAAAAPHYQLLHKGTELILYQRK